MARPRRALIHFDPLVGDRGEQHSLLPTLLRETDFCSYLKESEEFKAIYDNLAVSPATEPEYPLGTSQSPSPEGEGLWRARSYKLTAVFFDTRSIPIC